MHEMRVLSSVPHGALASTNDRRIEYRLNYKILFQFDFAFLYLELVPMKINKYEITSIHFIRARVAYILSQLTILVVLERHHAMHAGQLCCLFSMVNDGSLR